jgi:hypothetical protein
VETNAAGEIINEHHGAAPMQTSFAKFILPVLAGLVLTPPVVLAQQAAAPAQQATSAFDAKAFFETLDRHRYKAPAGFDSKKFFEELDRQRYASKKMIDSKTFFEELDRQRFTAPAGFDARKFWEEVSQVRNMPPMVDVKN